MSRIGDLVIDCAHPGRLARFWAQALDDHDVAPYDDEELRRLRALGVHDVMDDPTVLLEPSSPGLRLWFQQVPEPKVTKNRVHLDLVTDDLEREVARLVALGASRSVARTEPGTVVMHDPEGNEFCLQGPPD